MRRIRSWPAKTFLSAVALLGICVAARAQSPSPTPPASEISVVDLKAGQGQMNFGQPMKITTFVGYNNQPAFLPDGHSVLYASIKDVAFYGLQIKERQADIYRYDLRSGETTQMTKTPESEYSPTLMSDGKSISVVRVEMDGTQRLWKFPLAVGPPSLILAHIKPVGYHCWLDEHTLALFILGGSGKPNTLQIVDVASEQAEVIAENPGRVLRLVPHQHRLSFVHKISDKEWIIKAFDLKTRKIATLIKTLTGVEDFAWTPSGILLMAKDAKLFKWNPATDKDWMEVADFSQSGLKRITRLAVSPKGDKIALVSLHDPAR